MAKKVREAKPSAEAADDKAVFQVRINGALHKALKNAADSCGTSLNQLIQDICQACVDHMHVGSEAKVADGGLFALSPRAGCVFFGEREHVVTEQERELAEQMEPESDSPRDKPARGWFGLNYSASSYIRY